MRVAAVTLVAVLAGTGCGSERSFDPEEFVEEANAEGAGLVLGESLTSIEEGVDVYAISFEEEPGEHDEPEPGGHAHSGGSLIVTGDADAAREEHARCEQAVTLVCYRAANVVLLFDAEPSDEHVAKVDSAIRALETEG
jgi:hypothetical protein